MNENSEGPAERYGYSPEVLREIAELKLPRRISNAPPPIVPINGFGRSSTRTEWPLTAEPHALWNFAFGAWDFSGAIWSRRTNRPRSRDHKIFLADAVERLAAVFVGEKETRLRQAAIDLAVDARRGDLETWKRAQVGGTFQTLAGASWAKWFAEDTLPGFFSACSFRTSVQGKEDWWIYVDAEGLDFRIKSASEGRPSDATPAVADRKDARPWQLRPGEKIHNWVRRPEVRAEAEARRESPTNQALAVALVEMGEAQDVKLNIETVKSYLKPSRP